jgi:phage gp36-like protein
MVESLAFTYTSRDEIVRIFGASGVNFRGDDLRNSRGETDMMNEIIGEATEMINFYCGMNYAEVDLNDSYLVRRWATWIACHLLSQRRGNPAMFVDKYEETLRLLEEVYKFNRIIPRLPTREDLTPAMSNLHIDDRFRTHKIRVHPTISTGGTYGKQDLSPRFPFEWL